MSAATALRLITQSLQLLWFMARRLPKPDFILVQNPPAIPTLLIALIAARSRSARLVVDWHNFGCSMLALQMSPRNPVLRVARWYERAVGRRADRHLCVSQAMRRELAEHWGIPDATVLYDRPSAQFAPASAEMRYELFGRIGASFAFPVDREQRPALIVYPTSWTADEDYSLLLEAAALCDATISTHDLRHAERPFAHLLIVITGQGPLRDVYQKHIASSGSKRCICIPCGWNRRIIR